jgi:hypothetical protein
LQKKIHSHVSTASGVVGGVCAGAPPAVQSLRDPGWLAATCR